MIQRLLRPFRKCRSHEWVDMAVWKFSPTEENRVLRCRKCGDWWFD